ncbi:zinc finger protein ZXDC [Melanotaenia boesemani]|uniref:zinc finger protein ZXDC n=1 Tax=Melanotaenia boesemani TaxID=1250792 RepID=UPI001C042635|nr:zinc finger protein ZXDC [Melanotaenia boesemani]
MEIQGLCEAQNIQSQHGAPHRTTSSPTQSLTASSAHLISADYEADRRLDPPEPHSDNNNNNTRPKTSSFRPLAENGSDVARSSVSKPHSTNSAIWGLYNLNTEKENDLNALLGSHEFVRTAWKYEESGDSAMQMALPLFEGEEEPQRQLTLPFPVLRQQREDGAFKHPSIDSQSAASNRTDKSTQELYVVFNVVQDDGTDNPSQHRPDVSSNSGDKVKGRKSDCFKGSHRDSMEVGNSSDVAFCESNDSLNCLDTQTLKKADHVFSLLTDSSAVVNTKQAAYHHTVEDVVLTNKYGDKICGQICTENSGGKLVREPISEATGMVEAMETSEFISDSRGLQDGANPVTAFTSPSASETFSGTITINNQSIIVTIENGILTLAAPPEGYVHKEDDMVSLKEHLGMKDHEDIVLLNYDSGTKSIGKISTLAVASPNQQEEPRPGLSVSDSELALVDDCSLSELGTSLDSCPVKQETGALCAVTEADLVTPSPKAPAANCDNEDLNSAPLIRSKKDIVATFACPEPGCLCSFDSRQKLKVHLLNHAEDPRPYQCTIEGCGWAFATSYKLKRHLQSHDKQRPHTCQFEGCGRRFTTVYNLKAHVKVHEQDNAFICEICSERFRSATRLTNHQRVHFEPQRPHKCEFPGCEKTFITFSALFSHNRTHFRETGHYTCTYPGCDKTYDKACRLKIHMRSHTGERPFVCDSEGCGWSFTSMSKLLRHKRKHDDDRRFVCTEEGCGKSFTRAEHLKGHSITHLGTKPFQCHAEGCNARFSARSSLYIHSKKHKQDASTLRTRCPVANCSKHFSSRSSLKSHMLKHHHLSPDALSQIETTPTLTPSSELVSSTSTTVAGPGIAGGDQLTNLDLSSLFSAVPGGTAPTAGIGVGIPVAGSGANGPFAMDMSLVSSGILTIDPSSVGTTLVTSTCTSLAKALDPLIMATSADLAPQHGLEGTVGDVLPPQGTLNLDDVQTVTPEALGTLTALTMQGTAASVDPTLQHPLSSSSALSVEASPSLAVAPVAELLASPSKVVEVGGPGGSGPLLGCVEVLGPQEGGKVLTQFVFPGHSSSFSPQKELELNAVSPSSFLESGGSARTDYRAIQLAKKKKQKGSSTTAGTSGSCQRKTKGSKVAATSASLASSSTRYSDGAVAASGGLTLRDPVTGAQYVQIQLLQDDPANDGDLAFQLSSQTSSSHSQLTVDLPVNILQEPAVMTEDDNGSDNSQFTGSTINLQDLE